MRCIYCESPDGTQGCFSQEESFASNPEIMYDVDGNLMVEKWSVEGVDWEDCLKKYMEFQRTRATQ